MFKKILLYFLLPVATASAQPKPAHNLHFNKLASRWDEAMPLGNGMLGALVWQKDGNLRLSLDRADLWDERKALDLSKFNFKWVEQMVLKKDYAPVQKLGDWPYDNVPYPTKLPAAALEFNIASLGEVVSNELDIATAINTIKFKNGAVFTTYVHATEPHGFFSFKNVRSSDAFIPQLITHSYNSGRSQQQNDNSHAGEGLEKLGYEKGTVSKFDHYVVYRQPTYDGRFYEVLVQWSQRGDKSIVGRWTISNNQTASLSALTLARQSIDLNFHHIWWKQYWKKSSVSLPDQLVEKQYYLDMYKFGSVARKAAPAITLQAVWTADNGSLPPWRGDFHNDLNTQLSYWPSYTGNRLSEGVSFTDWLWKIKPKNTAYTKQYFGVEGLNVPGVVTLNGDPMGGWIQYSLSPTVSAWCAQHFYWQWKYSMDDYFLKEKAYPYLNAVATYLQNITRLENGVRKLPLSSSPEYNNNDISAWFLNWSNFDLSLVKFAWKAAAEVALAMNKPQEAKRWEQLLKQLPDYEVNETGFTVAPGQNLNESHRHFSQYMAIYPLALLDVNKPGDKTIISNSLRRIEKMGTRAWTGYSFAWMASLYARAYEADSAVRQLQIFASNFCSPNSFHLNGDQKGGQYSGFTYRPFTLEGNFAFAQGVHELLLQSRDGYVQVFPAVPESWQNVSFDSLRTEGAFLISAKKENGNRYSVTVLAEKGGLLKIRFPVKNMKAMSTTATQKDENGIVSLQLKRGERVVFEN